MRAIKSGSIWFIILVIFSTLSILLVVNQMFRLSLFGIILLDNQYMYAILALCLSLVFPFYPLTGSAPKDRVPLYDILLFFLTVVVSVYFGINGQRIISLGWDYNAPFIPTIFSIILWVLVLEAVRRVTDIYMLLMCLIFSVFPLFSIYMPGVLQGQSYDFLTTARLHAMGTVSILGIPLYTVCTLLIGFMLFGIVLQSTGGGTFFFSMAQSMLGHSRGGAAKISILASAFFGMISGSTTSNTLTIGSMTISAMKKSGFSPEHAAAIEACASTGGPIMPPVMGAAAFIMASFLNVPYSYVAIGAFIPACLYYLGLYVQVDGYAFKGNLKGLPKSELPPLWKTFKSGWFYILCIVLLVYLLLTLQMEEKAPFYASAVMLVLSMFKKETRLNLRKFIQLIADTGNVVIMLVAILAGAGLIIAGPSVTGVALAFSGELVRAVGQNVLLILIVGALASFVLGFGMTITACYIFLAIVMVPALVQSGIDPLAAHLFVFYWGVLSEITPPVALCVSAACGIAGSDFMKTGWLAMRLGAVKYIIPFFFAYNPALLTHGPWDQILFTTVFAVVGVTSLACGFEGYLLGVGLINSNYLRALLVIGGGLTAFPEFYTTVVGLIIIALGSLIIYLDDRRRLVHSAAPE